MRDGQDLRLGLRHVVKDAVSDDDCDVLHTGTCPRVRTE